MRMQGNTLLVAGGASGIGLGVAELLCRLGNEVIVIGAPSGAAAGLRAIDLDLTDPWSVAAFSEQVVATCPNLNMLVNISIAFPVRYLPGLHGVLDGDDTHEKLEAHRLGFQHLTGALLPHLRKRPHSSVLSLAAGPRAAAPGGLFLEGGQQACSMSVRKRWASAAIEVVDIALPSRAERMSPELAVQPPGPPRAEFISSVAHVLAEGLHEDAAVARLRALWPAPRPAVRRTRDDDLVPEAA